MCASGCAVGAQACARGAVDERPSCDDHPRMVTGKKLGLWAFLFFLVKGLLWLIIPAIIYLGAC